jgi:hypothetical protein
VIGALVCFSVMVVGTVCGWYNGWTKYKRMIRMIRMRFTIKQNW